MNPRIVIAGGGFGGLETALSLKSLLGSGAEVTVMDRSDHHSFLPSIHEVISGKTRPEQIQFPLEPTLRASGIGFLQDEIVSVDLKNRQVIGISNILEYDYLVLAWGAEASFYGVPGAREFAHAFRSPEQAEQIGQDVRETLKDQSRPCRLLIAGGGIEGVEVAGELIDLIRETGNRERLASGRITLELIQKSPRLLPVFSVRVQDFVEKHLEGKGVTIRRGTPITEVQRDRVLLGSNETVEMSILIWTGGIRPVRCLLDLPLPKDPRGWLEVSRHLHSVEDERVYGIGDTIALVEGHDAVPLPRVAYYAQDQALIAAYNIFSDLSGRRKIGFHPKYKPQLISLGKNMGIVANEELMIASPWVPRLKKIVERRHILTYRFKPRARIPAKGLPGAELRHLFRMLRPV